MAPAIPDRWIPYKACGKVIEGTRIICFKVPLRKAVQVGKSDIKEIWDIKALLDKIPNLGAVIDLTNTSRYYNPRELEAAGILHRKIFMPGRIIPPEDKVQLFMDTVDEFLGKDCVAVQVKRARLGLSTTEFLIGVHCTHGLNRTGYMVCRYMRDRLNIPAKTAIKRFQKARGYEIERQNYIADLVGDKPPPANFGDDTEVKPVDEKRDSTETDKLHTVKASKSKEKNKNIKSSSKSKRKRKEYSDDWRSEPRGLKNDQREDWRTEPRDNGSWRDKCPDSTRVRKNFDTGESSSRKSRRRNDSDHSFDYTYDY